MSALSSGRARRVAGLTRKETLQVIRDPSSIVIAVLLPLLLLFLFGYGVSLDLRRIAVCLVVEQPTAETGSFAASFTNSRFFDVRQSRDRRPCERDLVAGRNKGVVVLVSDFSTRSARGNDAPIQVLVDGSDPNTAGLIENYVQGVWENWVLQQRLTAGASPPAAVAIVPRVWFNPELSSRNFLLPGLVAVIMSLIGTILTALVVAREWERGTMEALMSTPLGILELLIGKLTPYFVLGMTAMAVSVAVSILVFGVPFRGSILVLAGVSAVFLLCMLAFGLLISTVARSQFVASQAALVVGFLPAVMLSGLIFEIDSMPLPIRLLTRILPARYFVPSLQTLFLAGDVGAVLVPNVLALAAIAAVLLLVTARNTRMRLD
jgi:ABC-2 type transport system permease protein